METSTSLYQTFEAPNHRMSAFCSLQRMPEDWFEEKGKKKAAVEQPVWVGLHPENELPLT